MKIEKKQVTLTHKTGKTIVGYRKVIDVLLNDSANAILLSSNCPPKYKERVTYYSQLADTACVITDFDSLELGSLCGKPYPISAMAVLEQGDSDLLDTINKK